MPIEDLNFPSLKIKMTTTTKPIRQPKLTVWQQQNPYPGVIGREPEFIVKPANKWLREGHHKRDPKMLFDHFWYENELCILFADSNTGKSVLAVQIGDSISRGQPIGGLQMTAAPRGVLYFDYELSDKQFHLRYSNGDTDNYRFHKRFSRATANPQANKMYKFNGYQDYIENELENALLTAKAKVLIIDNISCLNYDTNVSTGAATLMNTMRKIILNTKSPYCCWRIHPNATPSAPSPSTTCRAAKCSSIFATAPSPLAKAGKSPARVTLNKSNSAAPNKPTVPITYTSAPLKRKIISCNFNSRAMLMKPIIYSKRIPPKRNDKSESNGIKHRGDEYKKDSRGVGLICKRGKQDY